MQFTSVQSVLVEGSLRATAGSYLVDGISFGLVLCSDECEELLHIPIESWSQIRVQVNVEQQPVCSLRLSEIPEFAHP